MVNNLENKKKGEFAELFFASEALKRGFTVNFPHGDSASYDFILEKNGKMSRVQVKSTSLKYRGRSSYVVCANGATKRAYCENDFDFLAAIDLNSCKIFIVPMSDILSVKIGLGPKSRYNKYDSKWDLLID